MMNSNIRIDWRNKLESHESQFISDITNQEEKLEFRSPETIDLNAKDGCVIAKVKDQIIGCFFLRKYGQNPYHVDSSYHAESTYRGKNVYERATLWVDPDFRASGVHAKNVTINISKELNVCLLAHAGERLLVSISSNDLIVKRNTGAGMKLVTRQELIQSYPELRKILCEDDLDETHGYQFILSPSFW